MVGSIGARFHSKPEIGVATEDGKSYYLITSLLNKLRLPNVDVPLDETAIWLSRENSLLLDEALLQNLKLIVTTRKERFRIARPNVVCMEDLSSDTALAKQSIIELLHQSSEDDYLVLGIDPGKRTGLVAYVNNTEIESVVLGSIKDTVERAKQLIENAAQRRILVKIGSGMPNLAKSIARELEKRCSRENLRIQLVDERGTSSLGNSAKRMLGPRDIRAAKIIAFRDGYDYSRS